MVTSRHVDRILNKLCEEPVKENDMPESVV